LAENPFESIATLPQGVTSPRNYAEYRHSDTISPELTINKVTRDVTNTSASVEYNASKAGTVYYMVLPDTFDPFAAGITPEDFVKEFEVEDDEMTQFDIPRPQKRKYYIEGSPSNLRVLNSPLSAPLGDSSFLYRYGDL